MSSAAKLYFALLLVVPPILLFLDIQEVVALGLVMGLVYAVLYLPLVYFAVTAKSRSPRH